MMGVGNRDGEGVRGVGAGDGNAREQPRDHGVDLGLLRAAGADHGFLDQPRGIFDRVEASAGGDHQHDAAGLGELERRLRVLVDEDFFDGSGVGRMIDQQGLELRGKMRQARGQRLVGVGLELAVGEVLQAVAIGLNQPPASRGKRGIETEDPQANFSSSSSGTS